MFCKKIENYKIKINCPLFIFICLSFFSSVSYAKNKEMVIQIIGAPASGKSKALEELNRSLTNYELLQKLKNIKTRSVDLDEEREFIASLPGSVQLVYVFNALNLFNATAKKQKWVIYHRDEVCKFLNKNLNENYGKFGINIECDTKREKIIINSPNNGINNTILTKENIGRISRAIAAQSNYVFSQLGPWDLNVHINRYLQLNFMMESLYLNEDILLDEVGAGAEPILERINRFREANYVSVGILVQPKTVGVNLLLNSLRAAGGKHFADADYVFEKYNKLNQMIIKNNGYFLKNEKSVTLNLGRNFDEIEKSILEATSEDNHLEVNKDKVFDLFITVQNFDLKTALNIINQEKPELRRNTFALFYMSINYVRQTILDKITKKQQNNSSDKKSLAEYNEELKQISSIFDEIRKTNDSSYSMTINEMLERFNNVAENSSYIKASDMFKYAGKLESTQGISSNSH
ncbi:hypothetical protein [Pigmentibacter ruber]|uniref:hypothetical protein n=1 Tax=Pigmentibacter ruber TaxID=2683196 RepID=UPI00131E2E49|nr:hypothetical protein [Pigmentibacter ruber]BFD33077.1 hypothetical protein GTC16762_26950 [Pigmentibacter ruber]